jgi:hypothetical protein
MKETFDRRYLAAVRFVDATTGVAISSPLSVLAKNARFVLNVSGLYVLSQAPSLKAHTKAFLAPPGTPDEGSLSLRVEVRDPNAHYLPRSFVLKLPRSQNPSSPLSLFTPVEVPLFRSPINSPMATWAVIYAHLSRGSTSTAVSGALVRVTRDDDNRELASSCSVPSDTKAPPGVRVLGARTEGDVAIAIPGIAPRMWTTSGTSVLTDSLAVTLHVIPSPDPKKLPDPDALASVSSQPENRWRLNISSGRRVSLGSLAVTVSS